MRSRTGWSTGSSFLRPIPKLTPDHTSSMTRPRSARDAEKRQAKLEAIDQQVAEGSLTIRTMTDKERKRFGIGDPERPFKRFFVPGSKPGTRRAEDAYQQLFRAVKKETGMAPSS